MLQRLEQRGCTLIDTTCGSVLNVWKNVRRYAEGGFTAVIHGKVWHEETQATASHAVTYGGRYVIVLDGGETGTVCDYIRGRGDREAFLARFGNAVSSGFDPDRDLRRIGLANQTTMLMSESLAIGEMLKAAIIDRFGEGAIGDHFQAFDTICSATQDRQDAVVAMLADTPPDLMIVIGDLSHRRSGMSGVGRKHPPSAGWREEGNHDGWLAASGGAGYSRVDVRGVHPGQPGWRGGRKAGRLLRLGGGGDAS
jgi:4-hydroxy-3-methylbut-2-enyl diphosphate reductase